MTTLRTAGRSLGVRVWLDADCQCYRATCPHGKRFEPYLHELVAVYGGGINGNGQTKREAAAELIDRLAEYDSLEDCDCGDCREEVT